MRQINVFILIGILYCNILDAQTYDSNAQAFITAAGITNTTQKNAVNQLVIDIKAVPGLWDKMKLIYPFVGGTANSHKYNLKDPRDADDAFRITWYGGVTHDSTGIKGNGTSGYGDSHFALENLFLAFNDPTLEQRSWGWTIYNRSNNAYTSGKDLANVDYWAGHIYISLSRNLVASVGQNTTNITASLDNAAGLYVWLNTYVGDASTQYKKIYKDGNLIATGGVGNGDFQWNTNPGYSVGILAENNFDYAGHYGNFSANNLSLIAMHKPLTDAERVSWEFTVKKFEYALSRLTDTCSICGSGSPGNGGTSGGDTSSIWKRNGTDKIYFNSGSVGIGTMTPSSSLEVQSTTNNNANVIKVSGLNAAFNADRFYSSTLKSAIAVTSGSSDMNGLTYWNDGNTLGSGLTSYDKLILNYGHEGTQSNFLRLQNPSTNIGSFSLEFRNTVFPVNNNPNEYWHYQWGSNVVAWNMPLNIGTLSNYPLRFYADGGTPHKISDLYIQNSRIGIGTETPNDSTKLDVNGNIYARGKVAIGSAMNWANIGDYALAVNGTAIFNKAVVKLYGAWHDDVFNKNYNLPSLYSIEKYVKQYNHLPEIPAAIEIKKQGIDMGSTQSTVIKKLEEMTLYLIDLNKKVDELKKENETLKKAIKK